MKNKLLVISFTLISPLCAMKADEESAHINAILQAAQEEYARNDDPTMVYREINFRSSTLNDNNAPAEPSPEQESKADRWYRMEREKVKEQNLSSEEKKQHLEELYIAFIELKRYELLMQSSKTQLQKNENKAAIFSKLYTQAPQKLKMVMDFVQDHPKTVKTVGFVTAEACSWWCCPQIACAAHLVLASLGTCIFWHKVQDLKKEL